MEIIEVVNRLRGENGCPWNAARDPQQLLDALLDEVAELKSAISSGATWEITEEIGDTLFNLISIIEFYQSRQITNLDTIDQFVSKKIRSRHPYVFDQMPDPGPDLAVTLWEHSKQLEKEQQFNSRVGVSFGYLLYYEGEPDFLSNLEWLKSQTGSLFGKFSIKQQVGESVCQLSDHYVTNCVTIYGDSIDFISARSVLQYHIVAIHGFSTARYHPDDAYNIIRTLYRPTRIESVAYPLGFARIR